jgi:hypothetical protein
VLLDPIHFAVVGFVIVPKQMQRAVKHQDLEFARKSTAVLSCISARRGGRDGDITKISLRWPRSRKADRLAESNRRKRQDVRGAGFAAIRLIHPRDLRVAYETNRHIRFAETKMLPQAAQKQFEWPPRYANGSLAVQDHPC